MPRRAHDCPNCACWELEDGETATTLINGIPVPPGEHTVGPIDRAAIVFTRTIDATGETESSP